MTEKRVAAPLENLPVGKVTSKQSKVVYFMMTEMAKYLASVSKWRNQPYSTLNLS